MIRNHQDYAGQAGGCYLQHGSRCIQPHDEPDMGSQETGQAPGSRTGFNNPPSFKRQYPLDCFEEIAVDILTRNKQVISLGELPVYQLMVGHFGVLGKGFGLSLSYAFLLIGGLQLGLMFFTNYCASKGYFVRKLSVNCQAFDP